MHVSWISRLFASGRTVFVIFADAGIHDHNLESSLQKLSP